MSIDDPMGGIFERMGLASERKEARNAYRNKTFEVACVKRILGWACPNRSIASFAKAAKQVSASDELDFAWLAQHFQGFPIYLHAVPRLQANWHLTNLWGNQFGKHPMFVLYHEAAEALGVDLNKTKFALLTRCTSFNGSSIIAMHNLKIAVDTSVSVSEHGIGDKHNTRIVRYYRNRLYCIEDVLSMMELVGREWASE
jgi:hypothetical protein